MYLWNLLNSNLLNFNILNSNILIFLFYFSNKIIQKNNILKFK